MKASLVSICVPVYNVEKYIQRCAISLFRQTYNNIEIIFVDDYSQDKSIEILENEICKNPSIVDKVRIIHHDTNRGLAAARNTGIDNANGDFIMHVDSDDWLDENAVEILMNKQGEVDADIVSGKAIAHYLDHEEILKDPSTDCKEQLLSHMLELTIDHVIWRRIFKKKLYTENNIRTIEGVDIGEDHYTLPRLIYFADKCVNVDSVIYHYNCMNESSYMHCNSKRKLMNRYYSDLASINILHEFFADKNTAYYNKIRKIKTLFLFTSSEKFYFAKDSTNYNSSIKELYKMGNEYLSLVGINDSWQKVIRKTYVRYLIYNKLRTLYRLRILN